MFCTFLSFQRMPCISLNLWLESILVSYIYIYHICYSSHIFSYGTTKPCQRFCWMTTALEHHEFSVRHSSVQHFQEYDFWSRPDGSYEQVRPVLHLVLVLSKTLDQIRVGNWYPQRSTTRSLSTRWCCMV